MLYLLYSSNLSLSRTIQFKSLNNIYYHPEPDEEHQS
jgi:hypothetical protein